MIVKGSRVEVTRGKWQGARGFVVWLGNKGYGTSVAIKRFDKDGDGATVVVPYAYVRIAGRY